MKCTPQNTIVVGLGARRPAGQRQRVADVVGDVLDLGQLVVVREDHRAALGGERAHLVLSSAICCRRELARGACGGAIGRFMAVGSSSSERSRAGAECVIAPIEMKSTPVSRPPRASRGHPAARLQLGAAGDLARPPRAARSMLMLSSSSLGAPAAQRLVDLARVAHLDLERAASSGAGRARASTAAADAAGQRRRGSP